jgi:hypothetical protein
MGISDEDDFDNIAIQSPFVRKHFKAASYADCTQVTKYGNLMFPL